MTTDIANFPSLTGEEFEEACHHLDSRYRRAALGPLRQQWKLRLQTALDATLSFQDMPRTIVEITRPLQHQEDEDLDLRLGDLAISGEPEDALVEGDQEMMDNEESDKVSLLPQALAD
jgi:ubiquitin-like-conjugating enzyme ATG10